ncbi:MAG: cyclic nucleotide-binding domain-containing protein [Rhodoferax sp.]
MKISKYDFVVDLEKIERIGNLHPDSLGALDAYKAQGLSSEDRLYYQLINDLALETAAYKPGSRLCEYGQAVSHACVVRRGDIEIKTEGLTYRVGPGAVLGLAAGLANQAHNMTATALTVVTASVIPNKLFNAINSCHLGLRGINRNTIMRILNLSSVPESLK